jgi:hypothetical protein
MLLVNEQTLIGLRNALRTAIVPGREVMQNIPAMAGAYIDFVQGHSRRWSMVIEYSHASDKPLPGWYDRRIEETAGTVEEVLRPMIPRARERQRVVAVLWAALEGFASLTASRKLSHVVGDDPHALVKLLLLRFLGTFEPGAESDAADDAPRRPRRRRAESRGSSSRSALRQTGACKRLCQAHGCRRPRIHNGPSR